MPPQPAFRVRAAALMSLVAAALTGRWHILAQVHQPRKNNAH